MANRITKAIGPALVGPLAVAAAAGCSTPPRPAAEAPAARTAADGGRAANEAAVRQVVDGWVEAFRVKSVDAAMALHAPGVVSFDIVPPLRYVGIDSYRRPWAAVFEAFEGPIVFEIRDLRVVARDDIAFSYSLNRMVATRADGQKVDYWFRWTACYQKIDGRWLIVHDHSSTPTDFASGRASLDLKP